MSDIRVKIERVLFDPNVGASVVLLKEEAGERELPIWIGEPEALSIAMAVENVELPRPMTHDLLKAIIEELGVTVLWVRVHNLEEGTFFATLRLNRPEGDIDIDARPSDAIALAARVNAPVFVAETVFLTVSTTMMDALGKIKDIDKDFLAELPDEVFGKYKM